ncbi:phosphotriesterase family protein [Corynebacterium guangdongense]|uniref:Phosphotriesterase-related protein n=1 Tax=Corynebacterium guangdongense TaxID=1783348 RepID=A0ABU1ZYT0_9CORY|nr:phosphotriesterase [Corynebacterium guangdongense]MDR7330094.1 phosphotriesterase-related protein [Corynebacterium guangdongense]WJZ18652.1 hypothetical protein CGUA_10490 [Corynebacterium guangdongense]
MSQEPPATAALRPGTVNTVLGPVPAEELGVIAAHDALLSIYPGAQYGYDVVINRADIFATLKHKLERFRDAGGSTVVDSTGMFHGRDVYLYESLQKATGVNIVASTGQGPEALLGGYFLTPQTNPPTPWPAEKFAELFSAEVTEGMVVDRIERRHGAGLITTAGTRSGLTPTDGSLFQGAARAARDTGAPVSFRFGADPVTELETMLAEGLDASRVLVAGLGRADTEAVNAVAAAGAYVGLDTIGADKGAHDDDTVATIRALVDAGHRDRVIIASSSTAYAIAHETTGVPLTYLLEVFVPKLRDAGLSDADVTALTATNPQAWLGAK